MINLTHHLAWMVMMLRMMTMMRIMMVMKLGWMTMMEMMDPVELWTLVRSHSEPSDHRLRARPKVVSASVPQVLGEQEAMR